MSESVAAVALGLLFAAALLAAFIALAMANTPPIPTHHDPVVVTECIPPDGDTEKCLPR